MPFVVFSVVITALFVLTASAVPLNALRSLVILRSASPPFSCVGVQLEDRDIITSAACTIDSPISAHVVTETSFVGGVNGLIQLALAHTPGEATSAVAEDVLWEDPTVRVLRVVDLEAPTHLSLPATDTDPAGHGKDVDVSIIEVDADTLQVAVVDDVTYVDKSQCHAAHASEPASDNITSICVRPLKIDARDVSSVPHRWQFLVEHDVRTDKHTLLGIGTSATESQERPDNVRLFTWLHASMRGETPKGAPTGSASASDEDRVLGPVVDTISGQNEFIAGIRDEERGWSFCTGSLIASRFVLMAAHCTSHHNITWVSVGAKHTEGKSGELLQVRRVVRHPKYETLPSGMIKYDIALLELRKASLRKPIQVGYVSAAGLMGKRATIMGYSAKDSAKSVSDELRQVEIPLGPANDECDKVMNYNLDETVICGGGEPNKDSCAGDSGGPVVLNPGSSAQRLVATVGIGRGCGLPGNFGTYALLSAVRDFIEETIQKKPVAEIPPYNPRPVRPPA